MEAENRIDNQVKATEKVPETQKAEESLKNEHKAEETPKVSKKEIHDEQIKKMKEIEKEVMEKFLNASKHKALISDAYTEMDSYVEMVGRGNGYGTIIEGRGGVGKTSRIIKRFKEMNLDVAYNDSYTTPASFFVWLYKNRDKDVVIVDDMADFMNNNKILGMLKGALWDVNGERIVSYNTTKPLKDEFDMPVPSFFTLDARIVIITNKLNDENAHVKAIMTRVYCCKVDIGHEEIMSLLKQIAMQPHDKLAKDETLEVYEFLKQAVSKANTDLNIRTLLKMFQFRIYAKETGKGDLWKNLSLKSLKKDDLVLVIEQLIADKTIKSEEERARKFTELTRSAAFPKGRSRATFFRLKKLYFRMEDKKEDGEQTEEG